jgi:hypothetical protein
MMQGNFHYIILDHDGPLGWPGQVSIVSFVLVGDRTWIYGFKKTKTLPLDHHINANS